MDLHIIIDIAIGILCIGIGMALMSFISKRDIKIFESGYDRGRHVMKILLFISLFYVLGLFSAQMTSEMIAQTVGAITGSIGTAVAFIYKEHKENGG